MNRDRETIEALRDIAAGRTTTAGAERVRASFGVKGISASELQCAARELLSAWGYSTEPDPTILERMGANTRPREIYWEGNARVFPILSRQDAIKQLDALNARKTTRVRKVGAR